MHSVNPWNALLLTLEIAEILWWIFLLLLLLLQECGDWFYTLYLLIFPTNTSHKVLLQGKVGANDHT
jgi:hypothetical protein